MASVRVRCEYVLQFDEPMTLGVLLHGDMCVRIIVASLNILSASRKAGWARPVQNMMASYPKISNRKRRNAMELRMMFYRRVATTYAISREFSSLFFFFCYCCWRSTVDENRTMILDLSLAALRVRVCLLSLSRYYFLKARCTLYVRIRSAEGPPSLCSTRSCF